uniref:Uncharacterized protein n=1 Tax=Ditylenchus dipsaci TaxID=166011 RepID=A0A915DXH6_9BILA
MEQWESYSQMLEEYNKPAKIRSPEPVSPHTPSLQQHLQTIPTDNSHPLEPHFHTAIAMPSTSQDVAQVLGGVHQSEFCLPSLHTVIPEVEVEMDVEDEPEEFMEELSQEEVLICSPSREGQAMESSALLLSRKTSIAPPPLKVLAERIVIEQEFEDVISPLFPESSSEEEDEGDGAQTSSSKSLDPVFDLDLGAFELVDSGVTAEALLSQEDPVIYHKDMPVHSVHHDTVQTEAAIENLMNAHKACSAMWFPQQW